MAGHKRLRKVALFAMQLLICSVCQGCHIEIVECDYEYEYVDSDDMASGEYTELEILATNCRVVGTEHKRSLRDTLFEFFNKCISEKMPEKKFFMPTLVHYMMDHTTWYRETNEIYCRSDTVACWRSLCRFFLRWESKYIKPVKKCIEQFGKSRGRNVSDDILKKPHIKMPPDQAGQLLNENIFLSSLKRYLVDEEEWSAMRWKDLIQFFKEDFICSYNFCNCTGLPLPEHEKCGDNWLTRLVGSTDKTSKYRVPLVKAASDTMNHAKRRRRIFEILTKVILFSLKQRNNVTKPYDNP